VAAAALGRWRAGALAATYPNNKRGFPMLKLMRDNFQQLKWALLAVVAAFVIGFVYVDMGLGGAGQAKQQDRAFAARVNGETIPFREYDRALYYTQKNYEQM